LWIGSQERHLKEDSGSKQAYKLDDALRFYATEVVDYERTATETLRRSFQLPFKFLNIMSMNFTSVGPGVSYMRPELHNIKPIAVEEHVQFPQFFKNLPESKEVAHVKKNLEGILQYPPLAYAKGRGHEVGAQRLRDMNEGGIAMQILSFGNPLNTTFAGAEEGLRLAQGINNELKKAVESNPMRFRAFAELPFHAPELAIDE
jgi:hypothetical protein